METKRRLFYLPEDEAFIDELTDSPRPRPSRLSRLLIPPSSDDEDGADPGAADVDRRLLVSYGSYILADGSGAMRPPPTPAEALALRRALRHCCRALRAFARDRSSPDGPDSASEGSSAEMEEAEWGPSGADSASPRGGGREARQKQKQQRQRAKAQNKLLDGCDSAYESLTVLELRERLRERNLPISGTKRLLLSRLQDDDQQQENQVKEASPWMECVPQNEARSTEHSCSSLESKNECESKTVWGTLLDIGSHFFRKSTSSLLGDKEIDRKRRRSA